MVSELSWDDAHTTWEESHFNWDDCIKSDIYDSIVKIIGKTNSHDILHLDSACKTGCQIFLTSDKGDIESKKSELEPICKFRILCSQDEQEVIECIQALKKGP